MRESNTRMSQSGGRPGMDRHLFSLNVEVGGNIAMTRIATTGHIKGVEH